MRFLQVVHKKDMALVGHLDLIEFLEELYSEKGLGYSALNTARSAVSTMLELLYDNPIGKHALVCRFLRGVFQSRPSLPRYASAWDVDKVLSSLNFDSLSIDLSRLTRKFATLLAILSAQRVATISSLNWKDLDISNGRLVIQVTSLVKQSRPGFHQAPLVFDRYTKCPNLCMLTQADLYLRRTEAYRCKPNTARLLLTTTVPQHSATKNTIGNWIRRTLTEAGVPVTAPHSTRSAAVSKAVLQLPVDTVLKAGGWSAVSSVFPKYYSKPIVNEGIDHAILSQFSG